MMETFICSHCGAEHAVADRIVFGGQELCHACLEANTCVCSRCGDRIWLDRNCGTGSMPLCESCEERYYDHCADCGCLVERGTLLYVTSLGRFRFGGRRLEIFVNDGTFQDETGVETPFLAGGSAIVTAPDCGKGLYGAVTQKEMDNQWHTHAGTRVPNYLSTVKPPVDETTVSCRPLFVPKTLNPWTSAEKVLAD